MYRPAKVSNLQLSLEPQEQILWLYVSVNHLLLVAVHQSICQFLHDLERPKTGSQTRMDLQLQAATPSPPASGPLRASQVPTPSQPWLFDAGQKCGSSAAPCRAPRGGHTPESSRSFAGHRNSCRDARCWDAWEKRQRRPQAASWHKEVGKMTGLIKGKLGSNLDQAGGHQGWKW